MTQPKFKCRIVAINNFHDYHLSIFYSVELCLARK